MYDRWNSLSSTSKSSRTHFFEHHRIGVVRSRGLWRVKAIKYKAHMSGMESDRSHRCNIFCPRITLGFAKICNCLGEIRSKHAAEAISFILKWENDSVIGTGERIGMLVEPKFVPRPLTINQKDLLSLGFSASERVFFLKKRFLTRLPVHFFFAGRKAAVGLELTERYICSFKCKRPEMTIVLKKRVQENPAASCRATPVRVSSQSFSTSWKI